jgi:type VII secretion protein EssB
MAEINSDKLTIKRKKGLMSVFLTSTQIDLSEKAFLSSFVTFSDEAPELLDDSTPYAVRLDYDLPAQAIPWSLRLSETKAQLDQLQLAKQALESLSVLSTSRIPYLSPDNLFFVDERVLVIHQGVEGLLVPRVLSEADRFKRIRALVLNVLNPKIAFEKWLENDVVSKNTFTQGILATNDTEELKTLIQEAYQAEFERVGAKLRPVNKRKYLSLKIWGIAAAVLVLGLSVAAFLSYGYYMPQKDRIVSAQSAFVTENYVKTLDDLKSYAPESLPKTAQYIAAASSVHLTDLTQAQRETILQKLSSKTDENTLAYWIYSGRGNFEKSLDLAQNIGDDQLTLLAYSNLFEATKLDSNMDGAKKQKLLEEYTKQISELKEKLEIK